MLDTRGEYIGTGMQYLEDLDIPAGLLEVGNCSELSYEAATNDIKIQDYTRPGGGNAKTVKRIEGVTVKYKAHSYNIANISRAIYGASTRVDSGTVTGEGHKAFPGGLILLKNPGASDVVIKAGSVTWDEGVDYEFTDAGLPKIKAEGGKALAAGTDITVDYSHGAHVVIQGLVNSGRRYRHVFVGLNEADTGRPVVIELYRVVHSPSSLQMISNDFGGMDFTADLEKDGSKGAGLSQYMVVKYVD
ncbi:hypothetical protein QYE80_27240 [Pseudomonas tohonis]|nr:hypothetical protein L682_10995 [Pseudomonas alcaligenes OT 69]MDN4148699.1 hypothetical protein [Pseudomonas tohonis]